MNHMEDEQDSELQIPSGVLVGVNFSVSTQQDMVSVLMVIW